MLVIPKKIKIGGLTYSIQVVEDIEDGCVGKIYYKEQKIKLEKSHPDFMSLTFMHEILHAMNNEMNETQIEFLAQALCQLIKDNPVIFKGGAKHGKRKEVN